MRSHRRFGDEHPNLRGRSLILYDAASLASILRSDCANELPLCAAPATYVTNMRNKETKCGIGRRIASAVRSSLVIWLESPRNLRISEESRKRAILIYENVTGRQ